LLDEALADYALQTRTPSLFHPASAGGAASAGAGTAGRIERKRSQVSWLTPELSLNAAA
jgi:hypothetical protein